MLSSTAGSSVQRNIGIERVTEEAKSEQDWFIAFFDDDFRPDKCWLEEAERVLTTRTETAALTGQVLADGVKGSGITETEALRFLKGS